MPSAKPKLDSLLNSPLRVVNVGLGGFAEDLRRREVPVVEVDWSPPRVTDPKLASLLSRIGSTGGSAGGSAMERIETANREGFERILAAQPVLVDVLPAGEAIEGLGDRTILHAGPPIAWERMCGPLRGAVAGICVFEGWAPDLARAEELAASGGLAFHPNHHFGAVGPMTGLTTRGQPVMVVENRAFGNRAYCTLNEGLGKVMRFGGNDGEVLERLRWIADSLAPAVSAALRHTGGIDLKQIVARGLSMGDEMHQRNVACSSLLLRELAPGLAATCRDPAALERVFAFIGGNDQFFLNVAMVMGKAVMDPVGGIEGCSLVTAMTRNGTDFGVRVSAMGERWFTAPVEMPEGLYFPAFSAEDANPDLGDSTIVETMGLGGFAMAAAPAVAGFVGAGGAADAMNYTRAMGEITHGENPQWTIPALDFAGVPTGIDIRKVVESGIPPVINTGIAHRQPGIGQVGAGIVRAPLACFQEALAALANTLGVT